MFDGKSRYTFRYEVIVARESTQTVFTTVFHTARERQDGRDHCDWRIEYSQGTAARGIFRKQGIFDNSNIKIMDLLLHGVFPKICSCSFTK